MITSTYFLFLMISCKQKFNLKTAFLILMVAFLISTTLFCSLVIHAIKAFFDLILAAVQEKVFEIRIFDKILLTNLLNIFQYPLSEIAMNPKVLNKCLFVSFWD